MKKRILSIIICLFLLLSLTACGGEGKFTPSQKEFDTKVQTSVPAADEVIAQNSKYTIQYDESTGSVKLVENATGVKWELCPSPADETKRKHTFVQSIMKVGYMDENINGGGNLSTVSFTDAVSSGRVVCKTIENGITIEYYFDNQKFMIPVDYVLKDDYLSISVDSTKIQENDLRITYVSLAPFMCSVENDSEDSYLFMPSGSGALLDVASQSAQGINYDAYIYGDDLSMEKDYDVADEVAVRLPVYGYKNGNKGGFAIIDKGAETAYLSTTTGNTAYGFSTIYPSFQLRGYTEHEARTFNNTYITTIFPQNMIEGTVSIRFYPMSGENVNYSAMADIYRNYLVNECGLAKTGDDKTMNVSLIGGAQITKSLLGIPYTTTISTTTVEQAQSIVTDLSEQMDNFSVKLKGYGNTGVDLSELAGGFDISNKIGSDSQLKNMSALCSEKGIDLYFDYDLVKFNKSGSGFSRSSDVIMNCGYIRSDQYIIDKAVRYSDENNKYRLLRPICFNDAVSKAISTNSKWQLSGVSLDTLTSLSYSDYSDYNYTVDYNARHMFDKAVSDAIAQIKANNQKLMASSANAYAAVKADIITDVPVISNEGYRFYENVPFYSMVFKGYIPMTTESLNLTKNPEKVILGAVEGGLGLSYTFIHDWDNALIDSLYPYFYSTRYLDDAGVKKEMISNYNKLSSYYESIKGAKIISNTIVSPGVHCTVFDNNVTVYVNYNSQSAQTPAGEVGALNYIITGGVTQ